MSHLHKCASQMLLPGKLAEDNTGAASPGSLTRPCRRETDSRASGFRPQLSSLGSREALGTDGLDLDRGRHGRCASSDEQGNANSGALGSRRAAFCSRAARQRGGLEMETERKPSVCGRAALMRPSLYLGQEGLVFSKEKSPS